MTSGLSWDETYSLGTPITRMLYMAEDMGAYVASRPLAHAPGSHLQYSSGSTTLLCSILAERSGLGANLHRELLLAPLGLASAVVETDAVGTPVGSSYMWATPRDWAAIGQFALDDGTWHGERLLPEGWMAASVTAVKAGGEQDGGAAGWWANARPDGTLVHPELPADAFFARGHDAQWIAVVPSAGLVVVRLGFTPVREEDRVVPLVAELLDQLRG
jgi:CubicO group peptidase (beta-lactamase class C family)